MTHVYGSDEDEVEKFEVTNDDIINEFNPNRPTFKQSKSDALYGIWAKPEESGYDKFKNKGKKDLSQPLTFISGGLKGEDKDTEDNGNEDGGNAEAEPIKKPETKPTKRKGGHHVYSLKNKSREKLSSDFGSFERHTKGIGMKLMQKMGYKVGKGLGVANQGIVNPVEALQRQRKAGLGSSGTERTKQSLIHFPRRDSEEEEENKIKEQISRWRKDDAVASKDYKYKTIDELKKSGKRIKKKKEIQVMPHSQSAPVLSNVKVIDMTGKEQKVLSGYHAITSRNVDDSDSDAEPDAFRETYFACPELEHNIEMLLNSTEQKILNNDKQLVYETDRSISLKHQLNTLEKTVEDEKKEISRLEVILETIDHCEKRVNSSVNVEFLLDEMADVFKNWQENNYTEYCMFQLSDLVVAFVYPLLKKYFTTWNPLEDSSFGISEIKRWKSLIQLDKGSLKSVENGTNNQQASDIYEHILWEIWMPLLRSAVLKWNPRNCESLIELLENWMPILPQWIMENVFLQLVLPRLQQEVENWNPLTDPVPLDSWIHPWLPLMESRMDPLYGPIKLKLGSALQMWHPRDPSAKVILEPWSKVFPRGSWDAFIIKYILPKLNKCMDEFTVNPRDQSLADFKCVMEWHSLIHEASIVSLLEKHFFAKWLRALSSWLNLDNVDYDEVSRWYAGWKSEIPSSIRSNPFIKERFKQALDVMNRAVTGQPPLPTEIPPQYYTQTNPNSKVLHPLSQASSSNAAMPGNFKDLLQQRAEERGIIFMRLPRSIDGKVVYKLGDNLVYIERDVVFLRQGNMFVPVSLETALNAGSKST